MAAKVVSVDFGLAHKHYIREANRHRLNALSFILSALGEAQLARDEHLVEACRALLASYNDPRCSPDK